MKNLSLKTSCLALICTFLWGAGYSVVKYSYSEFGILPEDIPSKLLFAGIRFMLAGGLTLGYLWMRRKKPPCPTGISTGALFCLSMFQTVLQYAFTYLGLALTTGSKSAILNQINVFLLVLLTPLFFRREKLTFPKCVGCILGFAGIIFINLDKLSISFQLGDGLIVLSSISAAISSMLSSTSAFFSSHLALSQISARFPIPINTTSLSNIAYFLSADEINVLPCLSRSPSTALP